MFACMHVHMRLCAYALCTNVSKGVHRSEECAGSPETGVIWSWELPDMVAGNQAPVLRKSSICSGPLSHLSSPFWWWEDLDNCQWGESYKPKLFQANGSMFSIPQACLASDSHTLAPGHSNAFARVSGSTLLLISCGSSGLSSPTLNVANCRWVRDKRSIEALSLFSKIKVSLDVVVHSCHWEA